MTTITASPGESRLRRSLAARWEIAAFLAPVVLFGLMVANHLWSFAHNHNPIVLANAASLCLIMFAFAIRRTPKDVDRSFSSWLVAVIGDFAPFALVMSDPHRWAGYFPLALQCCTLALSCWAVWNIREAIGIVPANRGIKVKGPYQFIRHPMYTAVIFGQVAMLMVFPHPWNFAIFAFLTTMKARMMFNEERLLMKDPEYQAYAARVRWRAIPGIF